MKRIPMRRPWMAAVLGACLAALLAAGCVPENPPPPPPPPPPPALPAGLVVQPSSLAEDTQGNLWFTLLGIPKVGRLDRNGTLTEFVLPPVSFGANIVYGPDGNLWMIGIMATGSQIGGNIIKMTPAGASVLYELPDGWVPEGITFGADGNLWFTAWQRARPEAAVTIGRMAPDGTVTLFPLPERGTGPVAIISGPDRDLWFTESPVGRIGRVAMSGKVTEYRLPRKAVLPAQIAAGPDGNLWFTENFSDRVGRMTPTAMVSEFNLPLKGEYEAIVAGPDNNLWIAVNRPGSAPNSTAGAIVRLTTAGAATVFPIPSGADVTSLFARSDGTLWFTERWVVGGPTAIGQITTSGQITETALKLKD
jgi:streptogramin lyase